ncbi:hypothetical protein NDU88_000831 [Pleurodeles waltl]|uniref:Uncharacterized protein n=1 Tax=Pleurodeles waltl TaxID=8319 RepID=A0AAV7UR24_PLEWA|nr:hypothetical protein NDU88_000831 [Pleurodeles waltl]
MDTPAVVPTEERCSAMEATVYISDDIPLLPAAQMEDPFSADMGQQGVLCVPLIITETSGKRRGITQQLLPRQSLILWSKLSLLNTQQGGRVTEVCGYHKVGKGSPARPDGLKPQTHQRPVSMGPQRRYWAAEGQASESMSVLWLPFKLHSGCAAGVRDVSCEPRIGQDASSGLVLMQMRAKRVRASMLCSHLGHWPEYICPIGNLS